MRALLFLAACGLLVGCTTPKVLLLQAPVVSMKKNNTAPGQKLGEGEEITSEWCRGDDPVEENSDGTGDYGLIDQTILKAHEEHGAMFFTNSRIYAQGNCVVLQANASKLGAGGKKKMKKGKKKVKKGKKGKKGKKK